MVFDLLAKFGISYDAAAHRYFRFGQQVLSVSSVLPYLAQNDFLDKNPERIEKAGDRGHRVARFIESVETWSDELIKIKEWNDSWAQSYMRFKLETGFKALASPAGDIASELFVYHDTLDYVGRLDLAGYCPNVCAGPGLIEVKATAVIPKTVGPQSAAYFEAFNRCAKLYEMPKLKWRASLHLTAKGYKFELLKDPLDFARFCSVLTTTRWARSLGMKIEWVIDDRKPETLAAESPEKVFV